MVCTVSLVPTILSLLTARARSRPRDSLPPPARDLRKYRWTPPHSWSGRGWLPCRVMPTAGRRRDEDDLVRDGPEQNSEARPLNGQSRRGGRDVAGHADQRLVVRQPVRRSPVPDRRHCMNAEHDQETSHGHAGPIRQQLHMFTVKFTLAKAGTSRYRSCS